MTGGGLPAEIWARFMKSAHRGVAVANLPGLSGGSFFQTTGFNAQPPVPACGDGRAPAACEQQTQHRRLADRGIVRAALERVELTSAPRAAVHRNAPVGSRTGLQQAIAVQIGAMHVEPGLGARHIRANAIDQPPEPRRVIHLDEMRHFMRGEIIQHERRRQDQPP